MLLCSRCKKNEAVPGRKWCIGCASYMQDARERYRKKPKLPGTCSRTDCSRLSEPGRKSCAECRIREEGYEARSKDKIAWNARQARRRYRVRVFEAYGGVLCSCCGEDRYEFLTMDHVDGGGAEHRRQDKRAKGDLYRWLTNNGFPPGFRVLCMNCNFALGYHGYCPHTGWVQPTNNGRKNRPVLQA